MTNLEHSSSERQKLNRSVVILVLVFIWIFVGLPVGILVYFILEDFTFKKTLICYRNPNKEWRKRSHPRLHPKNYQKLVDCYILESKWLISPKLTEFAQVARANYSPLYLDRPGRQSRERVYYILTLDSTIGNYEQYSHQEWVLGMSQPSSSPSTPPLGASIKSYFSKQEIKVGQHTANQINSFIKNPRGLRMSLLIDENQKKDLYILIFIEIICLFPWFVLLILLMIGCCSKPTNTQG